MNEDRQKIKGKRGRPRKNNDKNWNTAKKEKKTDENKENISKINNICWNMYKCYAPEHSYMRVSVCEQREREYRKRRQCMYIQSSRDSHVRRTSAYQCNLILSS